MGLCHDFMKEQMVLDCTRKDSADREPVDVLIGNPNKRPHYKLTKVLPGRMLLQSLI